MVPGRRRVLALTKRNRRSFRQINNDLRILQVVVCKYALNFSSARYLWDNLFFLSGGISAYLSHKVVSINASISQQARAGVQTHVKPVSSISNIGSQPKCLEPRAGTILPSVLPSKRIGSAPGPELYAKVHNAVASLVENPWSMVLRPS